MSNEHIIGIRLTADGKELVGEVKLSAEELKKLAKATRDAGSEAERLNASHKSLASSFGGISSIVKTVAASYAVLKVAQYAQEAALLSARYETLGVSMQVVGNNAGYTAAEMEAAAVGMQKTGISMIESRQQALRLVQAHIDLADSSKLARIAQDAAVIGNMNSSQAFATMIHGIQTGQTDVLRTIGLNINMEQSYAAYAATLGKSAHALTQTEKTQAVLNAVMKEGAAIAGTYEAAMGTAGKQLNSMKRYTEGLQLKFGEVFNEALIVGVMAFTVGLKDANGQISELSQKGQLQQWGRDVTDMFAFLADAGMSATVPFRLIGKEIAALAAITALAAEGKGLFNQGAEIQVIMSALHEEQQAVLKSTSMFRDALVERRSAVATDDAAHRTQVAAFVEYEKQVILTGATTTAKEKNAILMAAARAMGVEYDNKFPAQAEAINKDAEAYAKIKKSTDDYIASLEKETAAIGKNAYERKYLEAMSKMQTAATKGQREEIMRGFAAWSLATQAEDENTVAKKANEEATKAATKAAEEMNKLYFDNLDALNKSTASIVEDTQKLRDQNIELTYGKEALERVEKARTQATIATLQATLAGIDETNQCSAEAEAIRGKIAALEDYAAAQGANVIAKHVEEEGKLRTEMWKNVDDVARDTFVNIWGHGKSTLDRLRDTLKNGLLAMLYEMGKKQFLISVGVTGAGVGASGMANASGMGGGSNWGSIGSGLANIGSAFTTGGSLTSAAGSYGAFAGSSLGSALGLSEMAVIPGSGGMAAGSTLTGLGTAMPYIAAALAIYSIAKSLEGGETRSGGTYNTNAAGQASLLHGPSGGEISGTEIRNSITGTNANINTLLGKFGSAATLTGFAGYLESSDGGRGGAYAAGTVNGQRLVANQAVTGETAWGQSLSAGAAATQFADDLARLTLMSLQAATDIPQYLQTVFDSIDPMTASPQLINDTIAFADTLMTVRGRLSETRTGFKILEDNLKSGTTALHTSAETYQTDFLSAINKGISPETLQSWLDLGTTIDAVTAATAEATTQINDYLSGNLLEDYAKSTATLHDQWLSGVSSINSLTAAYDGSISAQQALGAATQSQYQLELQLIGQIHNALASTQSMFASTAESITLATMTDSQQYDYYNNDIAVQSALLAAATDPTVIESIAQRINRDITSAWGLLSPEQQVTAQPGFLTTISATDTLATGQLNSAETGVLSSHDTLATTITTAMDPLIIEIKAMYTEMKAAAATIQGAGNTMIVAAEKPTKVQADINFTANVPGTSEVSIQ